jgi:hypothetical protein
MIKIYNPDQPIPSCFGDSCVQNQPVPGGRPTLPARTVVTRCEEEYHSPAQRFPGSKSVQTKGNHSGQTTGNNSGQTTGNNSMRSTGNNSMQNSGNNSMQNSGKDIMHKVLNLHPTVQANGLKVAGTMLKIIGGMI